MNTLRDALNVIIFLALIAFIGMNLFRLALFFLNGSPTP